MRVTTALRVMAYGKAFDEMIGVGDMSTPSVRKSIFALLNAVVELFGADYLRAPNADHFRRILGVDRGLGFPPSVCSPSLQHTESVCCKLGLSTLRMK